MSEQRILVAARQRKIGDFFALHLRDHRVGVGRVVSDLAELPPRPDGPPPSIVVGYLAEPDDVELFEGVLARSGAYRSLALVDRRAPAPVLAQADQLSTAVLKLPVPSEELARVARRLLERRRGPDVGGARPRSAPVRATTPTWTPLSGGAPLLSVVPPELVAFLRSKHPRTLLIKGRPGTGKTTFALSLLEHLPSPGYYLSNRVVLRSLLDYHPTLRERLPPGHVVDASEFRELATDVTLWNGAPELLLAGRDPVGDAPGPSSRFPPAMRELLSRLSSSDEAEARPVVIVDSWEALGEFLSGIPARGLAHDGSLNPEQAFLRLEHEAGAHLIFVLETAGESPLDYFADGIVVLEQTQTENRLLRWLSIAKLRGGSTQTPVRPFTLADGRFRMLPPAAVGSLSVPRPLRWTPIAAPGNLLSWGLPELDAMVGYQQPGGTYLTEIQASVPIGATLALSSLPFVQHVATGGRVVLLPSLVGSPTSFPPELLGLLAPADAPRPRGNLFLLPEDAGRLLAGLEPGPGTTGARLEVDRLGEKPPIPAAGRRVLEALLAGTSPNTLLFANVLGIAATTGLEGDRLSSFLGRWVARVHETGAVLHLGVPSGHPSLAALRYSMLGHFRWFDFNGTLLFAGVKPFTPFLAIEPDEATGGFPAWRLRVVS